MQETQQIFINYQDEIRKDTILDRGIVLFENGHLKENLPAPFGVEKLDNIINASNQLNNHLEKHISKIV